MTSFDEWLAFVKADPMQAALGLWQAEKTGTISVTDQERPDKLRILVNSEVTMSRGKYAAQAVHAALLAVGSHPQVPVVVLGAKRSEIEALHTRVNDAGRTEIEPGTLTAGTDWAKPKEDS